jgi:ribosomal protein S18 acetylase RimI-like enzyme
MLQHDKQVDLDPLLELYGSVGWTAYTDHPEWLQLAVEESSYVVTEWTGDGELVGLARALSDGHSIFYLQDILVRPEYQGRGVGSRLLADCLQAFAHVRQKVLLTDDEDAQRRLYERAGFVRLADYEDAQLNAYVRFD